MNGCNRDALHHRERVEELDEPSLFGGAVSLEDPIEIFAVDLHQLDGLRRDCRHREHRVLLQQLVLPDGLVVVVRGKWCAG